MNERKEIVRDKKALTTDFRISKQNKRKYVQIKSILTVHKTQNTPAQRRQICQDERKRERERGKENIQKKTLDTK